jgi:hypothetical protein
MTAMNMWVPHTIGNALLFSAAALFVLGMIFWLEFVRMARPVLTVFMAAAGAVCGYFLPLFWHTQLADLTLMIMGMVVGIILGAVLFRLTQALLFAALTALLCGGLLAWHHGAFTPAKHTPQTQPSPSRIHAAAEKPVAASSQPATSRPNIELRQRVAQRVQQQYQAIAADVQRLNKSEKAQVMSAAAGGLLVVILLGLLFPRLISLIGGAWLGAAMILWSVAVFTRRFDPGVIKHIVRGVRPLWVYAGLGFLGMAIQGRHVLHARKKKKKEAKAAEDEKKEKKK